MKRSAWIAVCLVFLFFGCETPESEVKAGSPESVITTIVYAAQEQDFDTLRSICGTDIERDRNAEDICGVPDGSLHLKKEFIRHFENAAIDTSVTKMVVEADLAKIPFVYGDGDTLMNALAIVVKRDKKWYLARFELLDNVTITE